MRDNRRGDPLMQYSKRRTYAEYQSIRGAGSARNGDHGDSARLRHKFHYDYSKFPSYDSTAKYSKT